MSAASFRAVRAQAGTSQSTREGVEAGPLRPKWALLRQSGSSSYHRLASTATLRRRGLQSDMRSMSGCGPLTRLAGTELRVDLAAVVFVHTSLRELDRLRREEPVIGRSSRERRIMFVHV